MLCVVYFSSLWNLCLRIGKSSIEALFENVGRPEIRHRDAGAPVDEKPDDTGPAAEQTEPHHGDFPVLELLR